MFILKRQDVEIRSIQHPTKDQKIPILNYQGMSFRLLNVFPATQEEEARALWRELMDGQGKACILLEETARYSIWSKVRLDQLMQELAVPTSRPTSSGAASIPTMFTQACLVMLQAIYIDVEDLLGVKQSEAFQRDLIQVFKQGQFANAANPDAVIQLLTYDPLNNLQPPPWRESQLVGLLQALHRLGKSYFGGNAFSKRVLAALGDLSSHDRRLFLAWLKQSPAGSLWL
jgi:hypothetical protein